MSTRNLASSAAPAVFPWRRLTMAALVAVGVIALASLAGPDWMIRIGAVLGLAAGVVAAVLAVRALRRVDHEHRRERGQHVIELERRHGEQLRAERKRSRAVVGTLSQHLRDRESANAALRDRNSTIELRLEEQRQLLRSLTAENDELEDEIAARDGVIGGLRQTLATREEELAGLLGDLESAELYTMPRRVRTAERAADPDETELVDLALLQTVSPSTALAGLRREA